MPLAQVELFELHLFCLLSRYVGEGQVLLEVRSGWLS
jgi:hypothetical protein